MRSSLLKGPWYDFIRATVRIFSIIFFRIRIQGKQYEPKKGAVLVVANHQSHLDPPLIGAFCRRRSNYMARATLFRVFLLGWLIRSLDAIPIDREGVSLSGMKETLRRLKRGEMVLVFPEGSRSLDGQVGKLKPGFCALARRSGVQVMPVAIAGAFEAWPRSKRFPRPKVVQIQFGLSLGPEQIRSYSDPELIAEIRRRLIDCHAAAVRGVQRAKQFHASGTFGEADLSGDEGQCRIW